MLRPPDPWMALRSCIDAVFADPKDTNIQISGWLTRDYTYRSTGTGENNIAPVMNRFGDEFLMRPIGLLLLKALDQVTGRWGFNSIFIGGADASFLGPTAGAGRTRIRVSAPSSPTLT